jgi:hypothetical protein
MNITKIFNYIYEKYLTLSNKNFLINFNPYNIKTKKKAILYYKYTQNFKNSKIGTTEYQSLCMAKALNKNGYVVTIVDRKCKFEINDKYDIFVGGFNTGGFKNFKYILNQLDKKTKVVGLSTGANPKQMREEFTKREKMFEKRNKISIDHVSRFSKININKIKKKINYLIYFGYKNGFVDNTYKNFKNKFDIQPCISDKIAYERSPNNVNLKNFIYYSGSGYLHKGLDWIIEYFIRNPDLKLYICSPNYEKKFLDFYNISQHKNIIYKGDIKEDSGKAKELFSKCGFIISMNCSGGGSAALAVGRRYGLVPVVWKNEDCNPKACFIILKENFNEIDKMIKKVTNMNFNKYLKLSKENVQISQENASNYYQKRLIKIFKKIQC